MLLPSWYTLYISYTRNSNLAFIIHGIWRWTMCHVENLVIKPNSQSNTKTSSNNDEIEAQRNYQTTLRSFLYKLLPIFVQIRYQSHIQNRFNMCTPCYMYEQKHTTYGFQCIISMPQANHVPQLHKFIIVHHDNIYTSQQ